MFNANTMKTKFILLFMLLSVYVQAQQFKTLYLKGAVGISNVSRLTYYESVATFGKTEMKPSIMIGCGINFNSFLNPKTKKNRKYSFSHELLLSTGGYSLKATNYTISQNYFNLMSPFMLNLHYLDNVTLNVGIQPSILLASRVKTNLNNYLLGLNDADLSAVIGVEAKLQDRIKSGLRFAYAVTPTIENSIKAYSLMLFLNYDIKTTKTVSYE
jgi:hypothetical protein